MENKEIVNRVSNSALVTFDLESLYQPGERVWFDIKDLLFEGLILKEKDFRAYLKTQDWSAYKNKFVAVGCSADAIIPTWAFMLLALSLTPFARKVIYGSPEDLERILYTEILDQVDWEEFRGAKVVVKGCSKVKVPIQAYVDTVSRLHPLASSIMFGEPCSTVPLFKKARG